MDAGREKAAAEPRAAAASSPGREAQKAIRTTANDFVKACNAADVKAVGPLGRRRRVHRQVGPVVSRPPAIEELYAGLFKDHPGATMTVKIEAIRFFGPDIAMEKGIAT